VNKQRKQWTKLKGKYLFNAFALAKVFRARFMEAMCQAGYALPETPTKWVVDCRHVGKGLPALQYLSRYLYRGVISEKHILKDDGERITFGYVDGNTGQYRTSTIDGETFLWLVYQHVLPKGFRRVRDCGFLNGNGQSTLQSIQMALNILVEKFVSRPRPAYACKICGGLMSITAFVRPVWRSG
jgi:hypothetical protein